MFERADAFVSLPIGIGTLEEMIEQLTWAQLGRHKKPILIANIAGFWDPLLTMFEHLQNLGFPPAHAVRGGRGGEEGREGGRARAGAAAVGGARGRRAGPTPPCRETSPPRC